MEDTLFDSHHTKMLESSTALSHVSLFFLLFFYCKKVNEKGEKTSLYCSVKTSASCVL